jgi:hypothetical protein
MNFSQLRIAWKEIYRRLRILVISFISYKSWRILRHISSHYRMYWYDHVVKTFPQKKITPRGMKSGERGGQELWALCPQAVDRPG